MHPVICQIGPFTVYSYGLLLALAFFIAARLAMRQAVKQGISADIISGVCFTAVISGIIGARIFFISYNLEFYLSHPLEIIMLQHGGLSWFGGMFLGIISAVVYLKIKKFSVYTVLDIMAPFIVLAQAIGRIGCLLNGCCYGRPSRFGIYLDTAHEVVIPTQIYSTLMLIAIFVFLRFLQKRPTSKPGEIFFVYLLLYSVKRFLIEFWRADNPQVLGSLTLFQVLSIALFVIASLKLIMLRKKTV